MYGKYFKPIKGLEKLDIYRFLELFEVTDHALGHAIKKLTIPGSRTGGKTVEDDVREARDTLNRWLEMRAEDNAGNQNS